MSSCNIYYLYFFSYLKVNTYYFQLFHRLKVHKSCTFSQGNFRVYILFSNGPELFFSFKKLLKLSSLFSFSRTIVSLAFQSINNNNPPSKNKITFLGCDFNNNLYCISILVFPLLSLNQGHQLVILSESLGRPLYGYLFLEVIKKSGGRALDVSLLNFVVGTKDIFKV